MRRGFTRVSAVLSVLWLGVTAGAFDITGTVKDEAGQSVSGAIVWLNQDRVPRKADADTSGRFTFADVGIGPVEIVAWKNGYAIGGLDAQVIGSADVVITLSKPDAIRVRLLAQTQKTDTGIAAPAKAIAGARVKSMFVNGAFHVSVEDLAQVGFPAPRSNDAGILEISHLPKGGYISFLLTHRDYAEVHVPYYPAGQKELAVQLAPGLTLSGRVTDPRGKAVEGARVTVFRSGPQLQEAKEAITSADGFYTAVLPLGDFYVWAKQKGFASTKPVPLSVTTEKEEYVCDIVLEDAHQIAGRVLALDDKAVAGVTVQYVAGNLVLDETLTSNDGGFSLQASSGEGQVHVVPPDGYISEYVGDVHVTMVGEDIRIEQPVRLRALPSIEGVIVDSEGAPASNTVVSSIDTDPPVWSITDDKGKFQLQLQRAPKDAMARFRAEHALRFERADFEVALDKLSPVSLRLSVFTPDTSECRPEHVTNKLASYRDRPAAEFECDSWFNVPDGQTGKADAVSLAALRGKVVVVTFWGGFDTTQRGIAALDLMNTLNELYAASGDVAVIGIHDSGNTNEEVMEYLKNRRVAFVTGKDRETRTFSNYNIFAIPQTVLIDKKGILRYYDVDGRLLELVKSLRREASG